MGACESSNDGRDVNGVGVGGDFEEDASAVGLARVLRWYLAHPAARRRRAAVARSLLRSRPAEDALRGPIADLVQRSCPEWNPPTQISPS